jgi:hypothetical protein
MKDDHHEDRYTAGDIDLIIPVRWYHSGLSSSICNNRLAHDPLNEKGFFPVTVVRVISQCANSSQQGDNQWVMKAVNMLSKRSVSAGL